MGQGHDQQKGTQTYLFFSAYPRYSELDTPNLHDGISNKVRQHALTSQGQNLHSTIVQLFGQRDDIKVEEAELLKTKVRDIACEDSRKGKDFVAYPLVPKLCGVLRGSSLSIGCKHFFKQSMIPLAGRSKQEGSSGQILVVQRSRRKLNVLFCTHANVALHQYEWNVSAMR